VSANLFRPHLIAILEDDANRQILNGFKQELSHGSQRKLQVEPLAGGWRKVLEYFEHEVGPTLERYSKRLVLLVIDLDDHVERIEEAKLVVPAPLRDRVFILASREEPELLKTDLGSFESIGRALARDCRDGTKNTWSHRHLQHNEPELARLLPVVRPILFP
jgi:hypothetical protein